MKPFVIVTDSTSDLLKSDVMLHKIEVVPLKVIVGEQEFVDGVDCNGQLIFQLVEKNGVLPKTSAASPADIEASFERIRAAGGNALFIGISSELSATIQNAFIAKQAFEDMDIEIVDSRNLSTGIGLLVMKAVDLAREGKTLKETADIIRKMADQVRTGFIIETLEYLYKGGRLSGMQHLFGSMLKIKPLVRVEQGKMLVAEKLRGSQRKVAETLIEQALADKDRMDTARLFVTHAAAEEVAVDLKERLMKELLVQEVIVTEAGSIISSHCGPGTVGIIYLIR